MPLQKRLPKYGFTSRVSRVSAQIRLAELNQIEGGVVDLAALRQAGLIGSSIERAKIFLAGELDAGKALVVRGLTVTVGARAAIEAAGGSVEALV
jgi:large subunit ribosomal protein L15